LEKESVNSPLGNIGGQIRFDLLVNERNLIVTGDHLPPVIGNVKPTKALFYDGAELPGKFGAGGPPEETGCCILLAAEQDIGSIRDRQLPQGVYKYSRRFPHGIFSGPIKALYQVIC